MIDPEITLILDSEDGTARRITVDSNRFAIGRSADNDLAIDDPGLSHRHALLEKFEGVIYISDCGSRNGTFVNGLPVTAAMSLKDGDLISAGLCHITVRISNGRAPDLAIDKKEDDRVAPSRLTENLLSTPAMAMAAAAALLVLTLIAAALFGDGASPAARDTLIGEVAAEDKSNLRIPPLPDEPDANVDRVSIEQIERAAAQVLRRVSSDDKPYVFPSNAAAALDHIKRQVEQYRDSPAIAATLNRLAHSGAQIAARARREGIEPDLVIYTALAQTDGGRTGEDAAETARRVLPSLLSLRATFGTELADKSLILVAAYRVGGGTKKSHPLLATMRRMVKDPLSERTVWHLHERGGLDDEVYGFVVKFLALGIIAQNPRQFGVAAAPLAF